LIPLFPSLSVAAKDKSAELAASLPGNAVQAEELRDMINGVEAALAGIPGSIKTASQLKKTREAHTEQKRAAEERERKFHDRTTDGYQFDLKNICLLSAL
jgi:hypothetical protein